MTRSTDAIRSSHARVPSTVGVVALTGSRLLVPVAESPTLRNTVAHAVRLARERAVDGEGTPVVHFVYPLSKRLTYASETPEMEEAESLLQRVAAWTEEDMGEEADAVVVETAVIGKHEYLFSPGDYADVIARYAGEHDLDLAVFDPGFDPLGTAPLLPTLESEIRRAGLDVEEAPVTRERRSPLLVRRATAAQFIGLFVISFSFYLLLAWSLSAYTLVSGAVSAGAVAVTLWGISLTTPIPPGRTVTLLGRMALYAPYLLWEVLRANLGVAYVVLHPDLPIDPEVVEFDAAVWSALPVTTLANSITLTPGTLTVDVSRRHFTVHTLTQSARDDLLAGSLERAVRFVFYGRAAASIPSPLERLDEGGDDR